MNNSVLFLIKQRYSQLRKSEKVAADYILNFKKDYENLSIIKMSEKANISQPTIIRFAKALGYSGFKELKYALIQNEPAAKKMKTSPFEGLAINKDEKLENIPAKITATAFQLLENSLKSISPDEYCRLIESIKNARSIGIYAIENSDVTAIDLNIKLSYLGLNCIWNSDPYTQRISASNLKPDDVAIGISYSGCSKITVDNLKTARESGATTVAITNFSNSPLSKYADIVISTSNKQYFYGDVIFSRTAQLAIVDMIYVGILISNYDKYTKRLDKTREFIQNLDYKPIKQAEKL